jgi:capsular exopolysaccharide synthesis family protein
MSTFSKALERAEQERALQRARGAPAPSIAETSSAPQRLDGREASPSQVRESVFKAPLVVPRHEAHGGELEGHLVSVLTPHSFEAEQYRALRHTVEELHRSAGLAVVAVSSPMAGDGKTTTAINLAGALAQTVDARILLVDADLRRANLGAYVGLEGHEGAGLVGAILNPSLGLESVTQTLPHLNLSILTAGRRPSAPYEVLKSARVGELLAEARRKYDYVIVDTPPLVMVQDSRVIEKWVDGFLVVVGANRTRRKLLTEALNIMDPTKIVGMIFNGDDGHVSRESYDSYDSSRRRILPRRSRSR